MSNPQLSQAEPDPIQAAVLPVTGGNRLISESAPEYHADRDGPSLSSSIAHLLMSRSALHAWHAHPRLNPNYTEDVSDEYDFGTVAHGELLEGKSKLCVIQPEDHAGKKGGIPKGWTNDAIREARDTARANGLIPMLPWDAAKVSEMVAAARAAIAASELAGVMDGADIEKSIRWNEGAIVKCRARPDAVNHGMRIIVDYKTTNNAEPDAFMRSGLAYGYDVQEAFYRRGMRALGMDYNFVFIAQEKEPPYACSLVALDPAMQDMADRKVSFAIASWESCLKRNEWRGYPNRIAYITPPAWYAAETETLDFEVQI